MPLLSTLAAGSGGAIGLGTSTEIDQNFSNVSFVLSNIRGTSVNTSSFIDSGTANTGGTGFTVNKFGNTFMGSVSPYAQRDQSGNNYNWSYEFRGGGSSTDTVGAISFPSTVLTANHVGWSTRTSTLECWLKPLYFSDATISYQVSSIIAAYDAAGGDGRFAWGISPTGNLVLLLGNLTSEFKYTTTAAMTLGAWNHAALTVDGVASTATMFINGVGQTFSINLTGQTTTFTTIYGIGKNCANSQITNFVGKMSNFRWSNTLVYTANFTPPTEPLSLIHPNSTHLLTLQNPHLVDRSVTPKTMDPGTNILISTDSPFNSTSRTYDPLYHGASAYFDGTSSYLTINDNATLEIGASDFTLECMFLPLTNTASTLFGKRANSSSIGAFAVSYSGTAVTINFGTGLTTYNIVSGVSAGIPRKGVWNHLAIYKVGSAWRSALNGVVVSLATSTTAVGDTSDPWHFGGDTNGNYFNGYMTDIRLVKGSSVYTTTTVGSNPGITIPTAPLTNVANTKFLLSMSNFNLADSTKKSVVGTIGTVPLANTPSKWGYSSLSLSRSSGAINGIMVPDSPNINFYRKSGDTSSVNDFTIEFWLYPTSLSVANNYGVIVQKDGIGTGAVQWRAALSSANTGNIVFSAGSGGAPSNLSIQYVTSNTAVSNNTWNHVACQRSGGYYNIYINGVLSANAAITAETFPTTRPMMINSITSGLATSGIDGYLSDLRLMKGRAVYTGATATLPTGPFGNQ